MIIKKRQESLEQYLNKELQVWANTASKQIEKFRVMAWEEETQKLLATLEKLVEQFKEM